MSTPPLRTPAPLKPPDLRQAHEQFRKQLRFGKVVALGVGAALGLLMGLLAWATLDGVAGLAFGVVSFVVVLTFIAGCMVISAGKERLHAGPAGEGPSSFGQVITTAPGPEVWAAVHSVLRDLRFVPGRPIDPQTVVSSRSLSMSSWGERLTVRIVSTEGGRGLVTVWSRPAYPFQWLDYGRNRKYANAVLRAIPGVIETAREPGASSRA